MLSEIVFYMYYDILVNTLKKYLKSKFPFTVLSSHWVMPESCSFRKWYCFCRVVPFLSVWLRSDKNYFSIKAPVTGYIQVSWAMILIMIFFLFIFFHCSFQRWVLFFIGCYSCVLTASKGLCFLFSAHLN